MCDQTEVSYLPDDVVWVKLGPVWWPGRVCKEEDIPPEIMKDLRKKPIAIVKFFQEDSFEYVKKLTNIYHYNCLRKNEFIKKGLDMLRSKNRDAPSNLKLFPDDVVRAEHLTDGNTLILQEEQFRPEEKQTYSEIFASPTKKTPKRPKPEMKKKTVSPVKTPATMPRVITHPRFLRLSNGEPTDYEARERKQEPLRAECDAEDNLLPTIYRCTECDYTTIRLNVMVWHNRSHTRNYASPSSTPPAKPRKRKSYVISFKSKEESSPRKEPVTPPSVESPVEKKSEPTEPKLPKTNGTLQESTAPKKRGRKRKSETAPIIKPADTKDSMQEAAKNSAPTVKRKCSRDGAKSDEFEKSLLQDWDDMEEDQETSVEKPSNSSVEDSRTSLKTADETKKKSCFDFDDDAEDRIVLDKSKIKFGRKIPRILDESKSQTTVEETVNESNGITVEDKLTTKEPAIAEPTSDEASTKTNEDKEFIKNVDKMLEEISAPSKLPEIPRPHKKVQLKAYRESLAREEAAREAEKARTELESKQEAIKKDEPTETLVTEPVKTILETSTETEENHEELKVEEIPLPNSKIDSVEETINPVVESNVKPKSEAVVSPTNNVEEIVETSVVEEVITSEPFPSSDDPVVKLSETPSPAKSSNENPPPAQNITKFATSPMLKQISPAQLIKSGTQGAYRVVCATSKEQLKSIMASASTSNSPTAFVIKSPMKTGTQQVTASSSLKGGVLRTADGKSILLSPNQQKIFLAAAANAKSMSGGSSRLIVLKPTTSAAAAGGTSGTQNHAIATTKEATTLLAQKSPQKAILTAMPTKSGTGKNYVFKMVTSTTAAKTIATGPITLANVTGSPQKVTHVTQPIDVLTNVPTETVANTASFIVDASGNLLPDPSSPTVTTTPIVATTPGKDKDILAKALENTDGLQTELTDLSSCDVTQNSGGITYKTETVYENLTLNTPPIMSAYETPSRTSSLNTNQLSDVSNEMIIISNTSENGDFVG